MCLLFISAMERAYVSKNKTKNNLEIVFLYILHVKLKKKVALIATEIQVGGNNTTYPVQQCYSRGLCS